MILVKRAHECKMNACKSVHSVAENKLDVLMAMYNKTI